MTELDQAYFDIRWPRQRPFNVVGLGLNAVDWICVLPHYPAHNTKLQMQSQYKLGGGQVATASALCARYGLRVRYVGRVGDDDLGQFSLQDLQTEPMDVSLVDVVAGTFSQYAVILVDRPTGERTILWDRDPALHYGENDLQREWVVEGQLLHIDGHDQPASIRAAEWAKRSGMKVSLDIDKVQPGVEGLLELTDFVIPSVNFVRSFSGKKDWEEGLRDIAEVTPGFIAVTRGKQGSAALWDGEIHRVPGITVNAVDTTGAGDIFHGAFIYALLQDWSVGRCLRFSNAAGALACTRYGARAGIPLLQEVMEAVERQEVRDP